MKQASELLPFAGITIKGVSFKEIVDYLREFFGKLNDRFEAVDKNNDIEELRQFFTKNQRPLKKAVNGYSAVPEDDDLSILKAYSNYNAPKKYIISQDEHFWGYDDLIQQGWNITVTKEWECKRLL